MPSRHDGPASPQFEAIPFHGNTSLKGLADADVSEAMRSTAARAPSGSCTGWGIPFEIRRPLLVKQRPLSVELAPSRAQWLVFLHATDVEPLEANEHGFVRATPGDGRLGEHVADYVVVYADGSEARHPIRRRHQIGMIQRRWGEQCFQAVAMRKPHPMPAVHEQDSGWPPSMRSYYWGVSQTRAANRDLEAWCNFLWAWENPHPRRTIAGLRVEPVTGTIVISALSRGRASSLPLRWEARRKALLKLPRGEAFDPRLDERGLLEQIQLDLGQVISAQPRFLYPNDAWAATYDRQLAEISKDEVLIEYTAHPDARFHLSGGKTVPVARLGKGLRSGRMAPVSPSTQRVTLRVVEKSSKRPVPVKLHVHGESGEYLAPVDRHRIPNPSWFEDYSTDHVATDLMRQRFHYSTYVPGETVIDLPLGKVYLEVSKGFEIKPIRRVVDVSKSTRTLTVTLEKVLPWRERGWVTADTHVHFLSPKTAQLEGAAEGVNIINLLASQWGELMTNVGDFDGKTTYGSEEAGGDGEWLVRVGTENRQHVLGHISLLGYGGGLIGPMCNGGPDESALGDPVGVLLTEWARECRSRGGLVVFPHFPQPRAENAAALIHGDVDAVEMCSIGNELTGIDPYSLSDWYRYLNCGYFYPAVGGTDKMAATTAVGTIRTYARIAANRRFTYDSWMEAVRSGDTFVSYGPLMELRVEGHSPGQQISMTRRGGSVDVEYDLASVTLPMTRVDLVVNGEIRESRRIGPKRSRGHWSVKLDRSSWLALLVRGKRPDRPEIIAAHSSPVMVRVEESPFFAAADAVTILEQIEGAIAYLDTVGTRADEKARKRMRLVLTAAHRKLHNDMHRRGRDHNHAAVHHHPEHRER
jgi:hypothetical protein